jgi:hypothetical protein
MSELEHQFQKQRAVHVHSFHACGHGNTGFSVFGDRLLSQDMLVQS